MTVGDRGMVRVWVLDELGRRNGNVRRPSAVAFTNAAGRVADLGMIWVESHRHQCAPKSHESYHSGMFVCWNLGSTNSA
jgi:hypothetical protein